MAPAKLVEGNIPDTGQCGLKWAMLFF